MFLFQQPPKPRDSSSTNGSLIISGKYVLGLGVMAGDSNAKQNAAIEDGTDATGNREEEDYASSSVLSSLLSASRKNAASLKAVPKGSVQVTKTSSSSCPIAPGPSSRVQDWFRPRVEVDEIIDQDNELADKQPPRKARSCEVDVDMKCHLLQWS